MDKILKCDKISPMRKTPSNTTIQNDAIAPEEIKVEVDGVFDMPDESINLSNKGDAPDKTARMKQRKQTVLTREDA